MQPTSYPVTLSIEFPDRPLNRLTTFFRIFVAIPILIVLGAVDGATWSVGTGSDTRTVAVGTGGLLFFAPLLMILFRRKYPRWWFDFNLELQRFATRTVAYLALMDDRYPATDDQQSVRLDYRYPDASRELNRWLPLVKWFLAIPHYIVLFVLDIGARGGGDHRMVRDPVHRPIPARPVRLRRGRHPLAQPSASPMPSCSSPTRTRRSVSRPEPHAWSRSDRNAVRPQRVTCRVYASRIIDMAPGTRQRRAMSLERLLVDLAAGEPAIQDVGGRLIAEVSGVADVFPVAGAVFPVAAAVTQCVNERHDAQHNQPDDDDPEQAHERPRPGSHVVPVPTHHHEPPFETGDRRRNAIGACVAPVGLGSADRSRNGDSRPDDDAYTSTHGRPRIAPPCAPAGVSRPAGAITHIAAVPTGALGPLAP